MFFNGYYHGTVYYPKTEASFEDHFAFRKDGFVLWFREPTEPVIPPELDDPEDFQQLHDQFYSAPSFDRSKPPMYVGYYYPEGGKLKCIFFDPEWPPNCYQMGIFDCIILCVIDNHHSISIDPYLLISPAKEGPGQVVDRMKPLYLIWRPL